MMLATSWWRAAKTYACWAVNDTYSAPAPIRASSHAATAISADPGARSAPARRRTLVRPGSPLAWVISKRPGPRGRLVVLIGDLRVM